MDKKKSRTDLLDAGRQKLQQFRQKKGNRGSDQKKDNKGSTSQGKSSKRSSKPEQHEPKPDTSAVITKSSIPSHVTGGGTAPHEEVVVCSEAYESALAHEIDVSVHSSSSELVMPQQGSTETTTDDKAELRERETVSENDVDLSLPNEGENSESTGIGTVSRMTSSNSEPMDSEKGIRHVDAACDVDVLGSPTAGIFVEEGGVEVESKPVNEEMPQHLSSLHEDIPDIPLIASRGDQVTDEDHGSHVAQLGEGLHKDNMEKSATEKGEASNTANAPSSSSFSGISEGSSVSFASHEVEGLNIKTKSQHSKEVTDMHEKKSETSLGPGILGNNRNEVLPAVTEECAVADVSRELQIPESMDVSGIASNEEPCKMDSLNPSAAVAASHVDENRSVSFLQLIDLVRGLSQDEYEVLCKSREMTSNIELEASLLERVKEELFVASSLKDILHVQLEEQSNLQNEFDLQQYQLLSEISHLRASFSSLKENNDSLTEELSDCRSKLYSVTSSNERLQNQLLATEIQVEDFTTKINQLQLNLEQYQLDLSEAKDRLINLQVENETLVATISSANDDKKKLFEEKESKNCEIEQLSSELGICKNLVASLQAEIDKLDKTIGPLTCEKTMLVEEKHNLLGAAENLEAELANCKTLLKMQEVESSKTEGTLSLMRAKEMKLEEDNLHLSEEIEKVHLEFSAHEILETALWSEYSNIKEGCSLLKNEMQKFKDEKEQLVEENDRLSGELLTLQEHLSAEQIARTRLAVELGEVKVCLDKVSEENAFLSSSLKEHKVDVRDIDNRDASGLINYEMPDKLAGISGVQATGQRGVTSSERTCESLEAQHVNVEELVDSSSEFSTLNENLKKAENILQNLEEAIKRIHADSSFLNKSSSKVVAPGVSKLIQAFESRLPQEEQDLEETSLASEQSETDPFVFVKGQIRNLRTIVERLTSDARNVYIKFKEGHTDRISANEKLREFEVNFDLLQEHINFLEVDTIGNKISFEALKQYSYELQAKNHKLRFLSESLKQRNDEFSVENTELNRKLTSCLSRIHGLESQLENLQQNLSCMSSSIQEQLAGLQEESERAMKLEHELASSISEIDETVGRLDDHLVRFYPFSGAHIGLDVNKHVASSVKVVVKVIDDLENKLQAACTNHESSSKSYEELKESFNSLVEKHEFASVTLHNVYVGLKKLVIESCGSAEMPDHKTQNLVMSDPFNYGSFEVLLELVQNSLSERLELQSLVDKLHFELSSKRKDIEELTRKCLDSGSLRELVENVQGIVKLESVDISFDESPGSFVEFLVSHLVQKFRKTEELANLIREQLEAKDMELMEFQENLLHHKTEIGDLRESLSRAEESLLAVRSELQEKSNELEQSEQRLLSTREKLSIAVAKGKGLVVQRDNLKQSLAGTSADLERCSEELKLKEARLLEVEAKLKTYAEAGERVEALESELSYIRNSATALRESFLLKDSLLHRIEEILEDLDLPEHFHARDILEKVEWLARSASGNSVPPSDWDQKSSDGAAGFVMTEPWREDGQPSSNSGDDLRIKFEELQGKFYGLAEQNEMLEHSLMQRNNLVQRWEELLGKIDMPSQLQSLEVEDKIEWLASKISDAIHDRDTLQQKIDNLENYCRSLSDDLEVSQKHVFDVEANLHTVIKERENLSERLENLSYDHEKVSGRATQLDVENENLQSKVKDLHEELVEKLETEEHLHTIEHEMIRLRDLINEAMQEGGLQDWSLGHDSETLEELLRKLIEYYKTLVKPIGAHETVENSSEARTTNPNDIVSANPSVTDASHLIEVTDVTSRDIAVVETPDVASLKKDLEETLGMLELTREEKDSYMQKQQSLIAENEALNKKMAELQALHSQEEQRSASVREKLNVAVRKGKSLVQQRDSLKQTIEEMSTDLGHLKSDLKSRDDMLAEHEKKIRELASYTGSVDALDSECQRLKNHLKETENLLNEKSSVLSTILSVLNSIDIGDESENNDPVMKLQKISQLFQDMHTAMSSAEQESRKSRRAAELLLAELNEVQERNDNLQEELSKCSYELEQLSIQKDAAEGAKIEALSRLEQLSVMHNEERRKQYSQLLFFGTSLNNLRDMFSSINACLADIFTKDMEFLHHLEANLKSRVEQTDAYLAAWPHLSSASVNFIDKDNSSRSSAWSDINMQKISSDGDMTEICNSLAQNVDELMMDIDLFKENISKHLVSWHEQVNIAADVTDTFFRSFGKDKDLEIASLHEKITLLHGVCSNVFVEIESKRAELIGNGVMDTNIRHQAARTDDRFSLGEGDDLLTLESISSMVDRLSLAVKDFVVANAEMVERNQKEMKMINANLQRELQEKDFQRERMCTELVGQIKNAQADAKKFAAELQSSSVWMRDMQNELDISVKERDSLAERVKELHDGQASYSELQEKVKSLGDQLVAKDQEIEALMQALDEEESQMEDLRHKVTDLEQEIQRKNLDLRNAEASRGKIAKKLSITMDKFDELHHLSETLLAEIEKLQQQLQDRDSEISFLRQEVTRCTNEVLAASQMNTKRDSDEIQAVLSWLNSMSLLFGMEDSTSDDVRGQVHNYMEILEKKIASLISELDELRLVGQSKDTLLEAERSRVSELRQREETLEKILCEKESRANVATTSTSEIVEVEPVIHKWGASGTSIPSQVRSLRKGNNDQVAISIDTDQTGQSGSLEEDDDKAHGFKSLSTSRIVPRFTRPVTDVIDGLWVSCDRTLMRKPALRLGIMIYWAILHALLATFVV
ncbi:PREDICTED: A-kinase anchor protein 9 isoform X2 [Tarenaya hassleriana]|uniref:A-kinase anchor protein 9 isoform X2 n=1 Tax=Tarenaya hassleriana TaxID=28532 RepID=UPI00053C293F|nr:PREDICTED: A-kinase anchor protein 9 isoform X2 [Tarenaya hassleriana]